MARRILYAILGVVVLLPIAAFCLFGFAATFEPTDRPGAVWAFRIGYAVVGLGCLAGVVTFVARSIRRGMNVA
jgi:hypothetical protein